MKDLKLMATLWPSFPHYRRFVKDQRLSGIRLNSAMIDNVELGHDLERVDLNDENSLPLHFDIKSRQLRIEEVFDHPDFLDVTLNHPIGVRTPTPVLFKAGEDYAILKEIKEGGRRLIFKGGPKWTVKAGESLHIRDKSLEIFGPQFTDAELSKLEKVVAAGFTKFCLSYTQGQRDVDQFEEIVGRDKEVRLKIEDEKGLMFVESGFRKRDGLYLLAARGDLYVELEKPHLMPNALKLIIEKDPEACVGSRILLSQIHPILADVRFALQYLDRNDEGRASVEEIISSLTETHPPSCADFLELAWMYDIGFREMMLCDELCLKEEWLAASINAFDSFRESYCKAEANLEKMIPETKTKKKLKNFIQSIFLRKQHNC